MTNVERVNTVTRNNMITGGQERAQNGSARRPESKMGRGGNPVIPIGLSFSNKCRKRARRRTRGRMFIMHRCCFSCRDRTDAHPPRVVVPYPPGGARSVVGAPP